MTEAAQEMVDAGPEPTLDDLYNPSGDTDDEIPPLAAEQDNEAAPAGDDAAGSTADEAAADSEDAPPSGASKSVPLAGLLDERDKRKTAEAEAAELRRKLEEATKPTEAPPSVFDDEDAAFNERITPIVGQFQSELVRNRFELSREMMMMAKDDFETRESEFLALAADRPELVSQLQESPNPARFAYETAVKHEELQAMENIDEWREKERAKLREELQAEMQGEQSEAERKAAEKRAIGKSPSLASETSKGGADTGIDEDEDLGAVLGG